MARRNIFQPPAPPSEPVAAMPRSSFPGTGAMNGMKSTLRDLSSNAVRELDTAVIEEAGPKDRLAFSDQDVADLVESIRQHGQQVPIMVRPVPERPGHYRVIYGRRRLRALRLLGLPAKAMVRTLTDEQAILAQGQENSLRLDPSFIEKALFVGELVASGYAWPVIMDALAIDKPMLSRMAKVHDTLPASVIRSIGPAHGVGRRRWEDLADLTRNHTLDIAVIGETALGSARDMASDARFSVVYDAARTMVQQRDTTSLPAMAAVRLTLSDGSLIGEMREASRSLSIKLATADNPEFGQWFKQNAEHLLRKMHDDWQKERDGGA